LFKYINIKKTSSNLFIYKGLKSIKLRCKYTENSIKKKKKKLKIKKKFINNYIFLLRR
jgi:hypothetical protein